jgi:outer membrane protein assembly factor BamB
MKSVPRVIAVCLCLYYSTNTAVADDPIIWKYQTSGGVYATPLVHNNVLYIGSTDSIFYAINATTGAELWRYNTNNQIRSTAAIDGNIVCFESGNQLYGLDLDGKPLWHDTLYSGPVTNQFDQWDYFHSSPNIVDGVVYIGTEKDLVYGINIQTGAIVFQFQTQNTNYGIRTPLAVYNNRLYFGDWDGVFFAYDLSSKQKVWEYKTGGWAYGPGSITTSIPVFNNGNVLFAGRSCMLHALNTETGKQQWSYLEPGGGMWLVGGPTISDSIFYLGSSDQHVFRALNAVTHKLLWERSVNGRVFCNPLVNGDYVYIGTGIEPADKIGTIYIFDKRTGELANKYMLNAMLHSSSIIVDSMLYVGSADKYIYAFHNQKLLTIPRSKTAFHETGTIQLGDLDHDTTITLQIDNTGELTDSITVGIDGITPISAFIVDPNNVILAPHTSQKLSVTIQTSQLISQTYYMLVRVRSVSNLTLSTFTRTVSFQISPSSSVGSDNEIVPNKWSLCQYFPNLFNAMTVIC